VAEVLFRFLLEIRHRPDSNSKGSLPRFLSKLASKNQSAERQARKRPGPWGCTMIWLQGSRESGTEGWAPRSAGGGGQYSQPTRSRQVHFPERGREGDTRGGDARLDGLRPAPKPSSSDRRGVERTAESQRGGPVPRTMVLRCIAARPLLLPVRRPAWAGALHGCQSTRASRGAIRIRNRSPKTLATYRLWMWKFQNFVRSKPADELDGEDAKAFLTDLAVRQGVAASTQNQAFNVPSVLLPASPA
jgi:hypothetical protein